MLSPESVTLIEARNYLVKGCKPQVYGQGEEMVCGTQGPVGQRRWMVVDAAKNIFRSQRHRGFERLAIVQPSLHGDMLCLEAEGKSLQVPVQPDGKMLETTIWDARCLAQEHTEASAWMSDYLGMHVRFVQKDGPRFINSINAPAQAQVGFSDRFHFLSMSVESGEEIRELLRQGIDLNRFRYNLLFQGCGPRGENRMARFRIGQFTGQGVKPCGRCNTINVDQETGEIDPSVYAMLKCGGFLHPESSDVIVGENGVVEQPGIVGVGNPVEILSWRVEKGWNRSYAERPREDFLGSAWRAFRSLGFRGLWKHLRR